jgi:hypothetical protein
MIQTFRELVPQLLATSPLMLAEALSSAGVMRVMLMTPSINRSKFNA